VIKISDWCELQAFSPNLKYIVSIGTQHDMMVNVWNWKTNIKVASNKVASKVKLATICTLCTYFVSYFRRLLLLIAYLILADLSRYLSFSFACILIPNCCLQMFCAYLQIR